MLAGLFGWEDALLSDAMRTVVWTVRLPRVLQGLLAGAVLGGFAGANLGRSIGQAKARGAVIVIGVVLALVLWWQQG